MGRRALFVALLLVVPTLQLQSTPSAARPIAVRAGRLCDGKSDHRLINQVVLVDGEKITEGAK
jgi:hypothetical protein